MALDTSTSSLKKLSFLALDSQKRNFCKETVLQNAHTFIEKLVVYKEVNNCVHNLVLLHITHILKTINRVAPRFTRSERTECNQNCK